MGKIFAAMWVGLLCSGCTISSLSDLPSREPGELFIICDDGQMFINNGEKACTGFMEAEEKAKFE